MDNDFNYIQGLLSSVWPDWRITKLLGSGSYGFVYEIVREYLGNSYVCALKVLQMETIDTDIPATSIKRYGDKTFIGKRKEDLDSFVRNVSTEIDLMMRLKGTPHIVNIEDFAVLSDKNSRTILIRMEALESVDKYVERVGPLPREEVIRLGLDLCAALDHCQKKNILHRDIKPSNIFHSGTAGYKLGDFGISRTLASLREQMSMTSAGTMQYMAPEVYFGGKYDHTVDIYSLGIVLYVLLNDNLPPFCRVSDLSPNGLLPPGISHDANMRRLIGDPLPPPANADSSLSNVICQACSPDPSHRFQLGEDFYNALSKCFLDADETTGDDNEMSEEPEDTSSHLPRKVLYSIAGIAIVILGMIFTIRIIIPALRSNKETDDTTYTVLYEDADGEILNQMTFPGITGETVKIHAPLFPGYTARTNTVAITLSGNEEDNSIALVYESVNDDKTVTYTIVSEDDTGSTIAKKARHGIVGQRVTEIAEQRDGYTIAEPQQNIVLSDNESSNIIFFIYTKDYSEEINPQEKDSLANVPDHETEELHMHDPKSQAPTPVDEPAAVSSDSIIIDEIPSTALRYGDHMYYAVNTDAILSFWEAKSYCEKLGGHLAVINDNQENEALYDYVFHTMGYQSAYFGLTNDGADTTWYWSDGSAYHYTNWLDGQPDNQNGKEHYALFYYKDEPYKWNDGDFGLDDSGTVTFLIEWDTER